MRIEHSVDPVFGSNSFYIIENQHAIMIDPVDICQIQHVLRERTIDFVLLTHEHYDHICGVNAFKQKFGAKVLCGDIAAKSLPDPSANYSRYTEFLKSVVPFGSYDVKTEEYVCYADATVSDEQMIEWQGHELFIKYTPGHSAGSICILLDNRFMFSGDTVFKEFATATRLPGGSSKAFRNITEPWLDSLDGNVLVYPGHTEPFRLSERFRNNH